MSEWRRRVAETWRWLSRPWRRPTLLASLVAAFAAPVVMSTSADLFEVAAADRITERLVVEAGDIVDVVIRADGRLAVDEVASVDGALRARLERVPPLGEPSTTWSTGPVGLGEPPPAPLVPVEVTPGSGGRFFVRDGAIDALDVVESAADGVDGLWISERHAEKLSLGVGDVVGVEGSSATVVVAGIHRDLWLDDRDPYWDEVPPELVPRFSRVFGGPLFELFVVDPVTADALGLSGTVRLDVPVARPPTTLRGLERLTSDLRRVERDLTRSDAITAALDAFSGVGASVPSLATGAYDLEDEALERTAQLDQPIATTSVAGIALGLVVSMAGAGFVARRRRRELRLLRSDGDARWRFFLRACGEFVLPAAVGAVAGVVVGWAVIRLAGPTRSATLDDVRWTVVAGWAVAGVVGAAVAIAAIAGRSLDDRSTATHRSIARWLAPVAVLAAAAWVQVGSSSRMADVDVLVVVFPVIGVLAGVGVIVALVRWVVAWGRRSGSGAPIALFLAWRRLVAAEVGAVALAIVIGTSFGLVLFPALLVESLDEASLAKATAAVGGESRVQLVDRVDRPIDGSTTIRTETTRLSVGSRRVAVQAIDASTYADVVRWNDRFGSSAEDVVDTLGDSVDSVDPDVVPAVSVGERPIPLDGAFGTDTTFDYAVVDSLDGAPFTESGTPTIIVRADRVDAVALERHLARRPADVSESEWIEAFRSPLDGYRRNVVSTDSLADLESRLAASDIRYRNPVALTDELATLDNQAARWSFSYFRILAAVAAAAAAAGLLLYLAERRAAQELADALTRRMGIGAGVRLRASLAEVGALVSVAFIAGAVVATLVGRQIFTRFEPDPAALPDTQFRISWSAVVVTSTVAVVLVAAIVVVVHLTAQRRSLGEILRDG